MKKTNHHDDDDLKPQKKIRQVKTKTQNKTLNETYIEIEDEQKPQLLYSLNLHENNINEVAMKIEKD